MAEDTYTVLWQRRATYQNKDGDIVQGYEVKVKLLEYDETTTFFVPDIKRKTIDTLVAQFLADRAELP